MRILELSIVSFTKYFRLHVGAQPFWNGQLIAILCALAGASARLMLEPLAQGGLSVVAFYPFISFLSQVFAVAAGDATPNGLSRALCQLHCHAPFNSHPCAKQANGWRSRKASGTLTSQSDSLAHGDSGGCGWDNWFCFRKILEYASALSRPLTVRSGHDKAFQKGPFANGNRDRMP